jgi:hypothetical protein
MLDCRLSSVLWHLEISSSRRSDQRLVISQPLHEEVADPSGNEQDSPYVSAIASLRAQADLQNPHQPNNSQ